MFICFWEHVFFSCYYYLGGKLCARGKRLQKSLAQCGAICEPKNSLHQRINSSIGGPHKRSKQKKKRKLRDTDLGAEDERWGCKIRVWVMEVEGLSCVTPGRTGRFRETLEGTLDEEVRSSRWRRNNDSWQSCALSLSLSLSLFLFSLYLSFHSLYQSFMEQHSSVTVKDNRWRGNSISQSAWKFSFLSPPTSLQWKATGVVGSQSAAWIENQEVGGYLRLFFFFQCLCLEPCSHAGCLLVWSFSLCALTNLTILQYIFNV